MRAWRTHVRHVEGQSPYTATNEQISHMAVAAAILRLAIAPGNGCG